MMYLYGFLYYPINDSKLEEFIPFEMVVFAISVMVLGLIIFKTKGRRFRNLILQDTIIIIFGIPFYSTLLAALGIGIDDVEVPKMILFVIALLTFSMVVFNDWKKTKKPAVNNI